MSIAGGPIDFYFEFSSPYGYIAAELVDEFEKRVGRRVTWRPILLGPVFKITGQPPLIDIPMKGEYAKRDFSRSARLHKVAYRHPAKFPIGTVAAMRAFYWVHDRDAREARTLARALLRAYFAEGRDISAPAAVLEVAGSLSQPGGFSTPMPRSAKLSSPCCGLRIHIHNTAPATAGTTLGR